MHPRLNSSTAFSPGEQESRAPTRLVDPQGRVLKKLRVQLLDACNYRCVYCMPARPSFLPRRALLKIPELLTIVRRLVAMGVDTLRLTGGEPLLRDDFLQICQVLSALPLRSLGLTTNGHHLEPLLKPLADTALSAINISLDSLRPERFRQISGRDGLDQVLSAVETARNLGFRVKLNTVVLRGLNDDEVPAMVRRFADTGIELRFLELMRVGPMIHRHEALFVPATEILSQLEEHFGAQRVLADPDATARSFRLSSGQGVGIIASESWPFCGSCSRLRLTAQGELRACLFRQEAVSLLGLNDPAFSSAVASLLPHKPSARLERMPQAMNGIGG